MNRPQRIYLDHAATSWPKQDAVYCAMDEYARNIGAAAGRGNYRSSVAASSVVQSVRKRIATLITAKSATEVSLHANGTAALNAAIFGSVRSGDHVVTTAADHNSVLRPLHHLRQTAEVDLTVVPCDSFGRVSSDDVVHAVQPNTSLVAVTHASNVTGAVVDVAAIGAAIEQHKCLFLVDAAQTAGYLPIDVAAASIDMLAAPGHKGLGGPLGTAFLYVATEHHERIRATIHGGTGSQSESLDMPSQFPSKLEAGNSNVVALAGLDAAVRSLRSRDDEAIGRRLRQLSARMHEQLAKIDVVRIYSQPGPLPIVSFGIPDLDVGELAVILDSEFSIEARAGLHCAALIHVFLGSDHEGTLRFSGGLTTTDAEIDMACEAVRSIADELS